MTDDQEMREFTRQSALEYAPKAIDNPLGLPPTDFEATLPKDSNHLSFTSYLPSSIARRDVITRLTPKASRLYTIGQVARYVGVSTETIRKWHYYKWLIPTAIHDTTGTRLYDHDALEVAEVLARYKRVGRPGPESDKARDDAIKRVKYRQAAEKKKTSQVG